MLNTIFKGIFDSASVTVISAADFLLCVGVALLIGGLIALAASRKTGYTNSFLVSLFALPALSCVVIMMVNGNVGAGVATAGAFSLVRFRSAPGSAKEIAAVFTSMALGLACGMGYPGFAFLFGLILALADTLYAHSSFGEIRGGSLHKTLLITVPESLEYNGVFDDIFSEYTREARLVRVKTTNLGSLNRLSYELRLKRPGCEKAMIDELRCRNGNLEISLGEQSTEHNEL